jgi:hypothetical protein
MESLLASLTTLMPLPYLKLYSQMNLKQVQVFVVNYYYYYHPNKSADLAAAVLRASSGDAAEPL